MRNRENTRPHAFSASDYGPAKRNWKELFRKHSAQPTVIHPDCYRIFGFQDFSGTRSFGLKPLKLLQFTVQT